MRKGICSIFCLFFVVVTQTTNFPCSWQYAQNVSYNLCNLQLSNQTQLTMYQVYDLRSTSNVTGYVYDFNICGNLARNPSRLAYPRHICTNTTLREKYGLPTGYCKKVYNFTCINNEIVPIIDTTAAYQIQNVQNAQSYQRCYRLHDGVTNPTWSLYQSDDAVAGVVLTYTNGDWCDVKGKGRNREFRIAFICDNNYYNVFDKEEVIEETETCIYQTNIKSIWGCPEQCKIVNNQLCNGNGRCDYDFTNGYPKCFCYTGYYGEDCTLTQDDSITTTYKDDDAKYVGLLIIVVILLVIVLTIFFYLWLRFTSTKYMAPKSKSLLSSKNGDDNNKNKRDKKQKQQSEAVGDDSDEENNVVV